MTKGPQDVQVDPRIIGGLALVLAMAAAPLALFLRPGVLAVFYGTVLLRLVLMRRQPGRGGRFLLALLTLSTFAVISISHHGILGRDAGTALLLIMSGLKLLEIRGQRDVFISIFLGFFLIVTQFLFSRSIPLTAYLVGVTLLLIAVLRTLSQPGSASAPIAALRYAFTLVLQATPIMLVLFLLFPRLSAPLWNLYSDETSARSGFSDRLEPGSISKLSLSDETAFRVDFRGAPPPPRDRYWRGQVFWDTDGRQWLPGSFQPEPRGEPLFVGMGEPFHYSVTLEPHRKRWMFALDLPAVVPERASMGRDFQILADDPIFELRRYTLTSYTRYRASELSVGDRRRALHTPPTVTPRMRELVERWTSEVTSSQQMVDRALEYFRREQFVYTLLPPALGANPTDEFLFETRRGFCEHFATSFTILMRMAGLPTRVVTGYQGGEMNPHGDYLIVRQSDAHAWTEVWLEDRGWARVDPTAAVAPDRVEMAIDPVATALGAPIQFRLAQSGLALDLLHQARLLVDAVSMGWSRWVLSYDTRTQAFLLAAIGLDFIREEGLPVAVVVVSGVVLLAMAGTLRRSDQVVPDPAQKLYLRYCARLARRGIKRRPTEGPRDFARRVIRRRPDLGDKAEKITSAYLALRYGRFGGSRDLEQLKKLVREFRP